MAKIVVLAQQGIEPSVGRYDFLIQGDPSVLGLAAAIGSLAVQTDSATPFAQWQKLTTSDTGWSLVAQSANAGASSSTGSWRVSAFNVPVDGTTDAVAALATLTGTTMPQTGGPFSLIIGPGESVKLASDVTLPATVQVQSTGGTIKPASGKVLTLNAQPTGAGQIFDTSLGGSVVAGVPMTTNPRWWGADPTGTTNASPAVLGALNSLAMSNQFVVHGGGRCYIPSGTYKMSDYHNTFGAGFSYITIEGDGPSTLLLNGTARNAAPDFRGLFAFFGGGAFALKEMRIRNLRMSGLSTSDSTRMITCDQLEGIYFDNVSIENNAVEGIYSGSDDTNIRFASFSNCHAKNIGVGFNVAAFNLNAGYTTYSNCTFDSCAIGIENMGRFTTVTGCLFKDTIDYGVMFQSTWSGFLDASFVQENTYGSVISNNQFINSPGRAVLFPDFQGHANTDGAHPIPAHLDGGLGKLTVTSNVFDRQSVCVWGGADKKGAVDCSNNLFSGQYDAGSGPQNTAVAPLGGTWAIHNNTFEIGQGIQWITLIGPFVSGSKGDRMTVSGNTVINKCWYTGAMFRLKQDDTVKGTQLLDNDGTIAAADVSATVMYQFADANNNVVIGELKSGEWAWWDSDHTVSMYHEPARIPVLGDSLPAKFSFKPGDVLTNRGTTAKWNTKRCLTGGTVHPVALTITGTATSGTKTITVSDASALARYMWISVPAVPAITNKQILSISGTTVTVDTNLEAGVTAGTSLSWATPTFITDRDLNTMSIVSQATGDTFYASSSTAIARLGKGSDGAYLSLASGVPTWKNADPRYDAGNTSTALTLTWTPERQKQKCTCTAATPTITIAGIPSGGDLIVDVFQDATGSRAPTFAQSGMASLVWANGNVAPTLTPLPAGISDRYLFENDGTRCVGYVIAQNT